MPVSNKAKRPSSKKKEKKTNVHPKGRECGVIKNQICSIRGSGRVRVETGDWADTTRGGAMPTNNKKI